MIDLRTTETRIINNLSRLDYPALLRSMIIGELNYCSSPSALRTDSEHKYFRKRREILRRLAWRKYIPLRENEDGRYI